MRNANKMFINPLFRNGEENEKVIRNLHADPGHHQKLTTFRGSPLVKLTTFRGSPLAHACQVWSTSVSKFVSYPVYKMTDRTSI